MLNKLFRKLSGDSRKKGFTMTELLVVIGIIAIVCAIAIPAIISMNKSLKFKQANEYAESIFMAAQANLTEMRSDGQLIDLFVDGNGAEKIPDGVGFPEDHRDQYMYATSDDAVYDVLLPATSIDSDARDGNVLIEYNPYTGNVYAVFYKDSGDALSYGNVSRDEETRRDLLLGYYCGSALSTEPLTPEETKAEINFRNDQEGIVEVVIPIPQSYKTKAADFARGLEVNLTIKGETVKDADRSGSGQFTTQIKKAELGDDNWRTSDDQKSIIVSYTLDSLKDKQSFANYGQLDGVGYEVKPSFAQIAAKSASKAPGKDASLTAITDEKVFNIYPGENISISADISFRPTADKASVNIHADTLYNINPMFDVLVPSSSNDGKYVLGVANGRNLQNLNAIAPAIAKNVKTVSFTGDINWNDTVTYYNGIINNSDEAPARALPYFVPIHNENLFGTAQFIYPQDESGIWSSILEIIQKLFNVNVNEKSDVPTLTDELDITSVNENTKAYKCKPHATVYGGGHKVLNLNIDSKKYDLGKNFYAGNTSGANRDKFTGLFGYVNTTIDSLSVVNPVINGYGFNGKNNPATGALVGAAGFNTLITNCSTYIDKAADGFNASLLPGGAAQQLKQFNANNDDTSYGVKGSGAVGGLVGYAKSHRTVSGELTGDKKSLAFSNCFAAVPVSGHMRGADVTGANGKHYGYTNGVGGLVGNAEISNFYNCYASGDVVADDIYVATLGTGVTGMIKKWADKISGFLGTDSLDLFYNGRTSMGAGGFVGTSHGVRYTNCFASGDIIGGNSSKDSDVARTKGAAGFVGIMSYEETHLYGNDDTYTGADGVNRDIAQMTVFQNCYAVGTAKALKNNNSNDTFTAESFSGANCRIKFDGFAGTATKYWGGSYYEIYAPWWFRNNSKPDKNGVEHMPYENFIFKDSYYISKYVTDNEDQTNACATPLLYQSFTDLNKMQREPTWQTSQINKVKSIKTSTLLKIVDNNKNDGNDDYDSSMGNYGGVYFGDWINQWIDKNGWFTDFKGKRYYAPTIITDPTGGWIARRILDGSFLTGDNECVRTAGYKAKNDSNINDIDRDNWKDYYANDLGNLESIYRALYNEGFSSDYWQAGGQGNTYAYDQVATGKYPFSKLKKLDYYGRWPAKKIACGIAYYEQYGKDDYGYYFDRDGTSTLKNDQNSPVISDGYAILTSDSKDNVKIVEINGKQKNINLETTDSYTATYTTGDSVYYVYRLPWDALQEASSDSFYTEIKVTVNGTLYTLYFNPNVALSQVNPTDTDGNGNNTTATRPATPAQVYIRSARQLAALGKTEMNAYTANENIKFVQQLDIDAENYTAASYANPNTVAAAVKNNTSVASFNASYTGKTASEKSPVISGFKNPIFKVIGENAKVSDLIFNCAGNHGSNAVDEAGLLAGINKGTVTNVDANVADKATVTAGQTAGLLIGVNSGTVSDCEATVSAAATVTASKNAGGVIGVNIGTVKNCSANITDDMTVNAANAGGFAGAALEGSVFNNVTVNGKNITGTTSVGAFAGYMEKTSASDVNVKLSGTVHASENAAGFAASVKGGTLSKINVEIAEDAAVSANSAAGIIGTASSTSLGSIGLDLKGAVTGTDSAVGAVADINGGSTTFVNVILSGGKIAAANNAAGFTLTVGSHIENSVVCGRGEITASAADGNAAGFAVDVAASVNANDGLFNCFVSPADHTKTNLKAAYRASSIDALKISAANGSAAGFAVNVSGVVNNSTALGTVSGNAAAGFAVNVESNGSINGCMANTAVSGSAFAANNVGQVFNSYAWFTKGTVDNVQKDENGSAAHYYACYFAPIGSEDKDPVTVVKGTQVDKLSYDGLAALTPEELCPIEQRNIWKLAGKDSSYPFSDLRPSNYAYPMLREHYGDWENPTQYAYGVAYYEKSGNDIVSMKLVDLSHISTTEQRERFSLESFASDSTNITETGYAVFYQNPAQIIIGGIGDVESSDKYEELTVTADQLNGLKVGEKEATDAQIADFLNTYKFRIWPDTKNAQATKGIKINGLDGGTHMIVPAYANAIIKDWTAESAKDTATYEIRTANQFGNINAGLGQASAAAGFTQTHSIELTSPLDNFKSMSYDGKNHEIKIVGESGLTHGIFGAVSGDSETKAVIRNVKVTDAKLNAITTAGILADTVDENSEVTDVEIVDPQIAINIPDYKTGTTVAVGAVAGQSLGNISNVSITMSELKDADGNAEKDKDGKPVYKTFVIDASATKLIEGTLNLYVGGLVGNNSGVINGDKTEVTANISYIPAAAKEGGEGSIDALMSFGGLVGTNNKTVSGSMTGDISFGSIALADDDKEVKLTDNIKLGGLVGHSTLAEASVSGTVVGNISYTRPAVVSDNENADSTGKTVTDNVMLGGLVGESKSGKVGGTFAGKAEKADEADKTITIAKAKSIIVDTEDTAKNTYVIDTNISGTTYLGGLVGSMNGGSIANGLNASGSVTVNGTATKSYIGGAIGYTKGVTVSNVTTDSVINVDSCNGEQYVGGIVGKMENGSMGASGSTTSAKGAITVNGNATANTYVGGAVGYESNATSFNNVKAEVKISNNGGSWLAKANVNANNATCPGSYANVGQFIGYVTKASFTDCSGNGGNGNNAGLQFLGTIQKTQGTISGSNYYYFKDGGKTGTVELRNYISGWNNYRLVSNSNVEFAGVNNGETYDNFAATLTNCFYYDETGTQHQQQINTVKYFYTYKDDNGGHKHYSTGNPVTSMTATNNYIIVDYTGNYALTANGTAIGTMQFENAFDDDRSSIWTYEGTNKLKNNKEGIRYNYLEIKKDLTNDHAEMVENSGLFLIENAGDDFVRFYDTYKPLFSSTQKWYMYMSGASIYADLTKNPGDSAMFKIYPVIAYDFTRGTMNSTNYYHQLITSVPVN